MAGYAVGREPIAGRTEIVFMVAPGHFPARPGSCINVVSIFLLAILAVTLGSSAAEPGRAPGPSSAWPEYKIGDTANEEIVAPMQMVVVDLEETTALKQKEGARVPAICRYYTNTADEVENNFRSIFATTRSNFLEAVGAAFNRRQLEADDIASPNFQRIATIFQKQNRSFPISTNLAELWARGESDQMIQVSLAARLREVMARPIRASGNPAVKFGYTVRLVPLRNQEEIVTLETAEKRGWNTSRSNIMTWPKVRDELQEGFPPEERAMAKFLVSLLKTNCVPDADLTGQARAQRTDPIWAADRYEAGQVIVKPGQVIDR